MVRNLHRLLGISALAVATFGAGAAFTGAVSAQTPPVRGEVGSARSIERADDRLHRMIANLQRDQRDYGGHRVRAIGYLQQADGELRAALQYDATSGH